MPAANVALPSLNTDLDYRRRLLDEYHRLKDIHTLVAPLPLWTESYKVNGDFQLETLASFPRLQAALAASTAYHPGKWLLEHELALRHADPADPARKTWEGRGDVYDAAARARLSGICLSGGGIRSATFCLGVLQALSARNKLEDFDYISSVSGGGYIHQWLASWIWNEKDGFPAVAKGLTPLPTPGCPARTPEQITWLRRYSSYLTPRRGLLSADTWTMVTTWLRNTTLNQIVLFSFFVLAIMVTKAAAWPFTTSHPPRYHTLLEVLDWAAIILLPPYLLISTFFLGRAFVLLGGAAGRKGALTRPLNAYQVVLTIAVPALLFAYLMALQTLYFSGHRTLHCPRIVYAWGGYIFLLLAAITLCSKTWAELKELKLPIGRVLAVSLFLCSAAGCAALSSSLAWWALTPLPPTPHVNTVVATKPAQQVVSVPCDGCGSESSAACAVSSGGSKHCEVPVDGVKSWPPAFYSEACWKADLPATTIRQSRLYCLSASLADTLNRHLLKSPTLRRGAVFDESPVSPITPGHLLAVLGPSIFYFFQYLAFRLQVGLLGRHLPESRREWLARLGAWSAILNAAWIALGSVVLFAPFVFDAFLETSLSRKALAWLAVVAGHALTLYSGSSSKTDGRPNPKSWFGYSAFDLVGIIGAPLCILTLLLISAGVVDRLTKGTFLQTSLVFAIALGTFLLFGWRVDINDFSMAPFYRNRLARCYLGGNNPERSPDPFTGFDDHEQAMRNTDFPFHWLLPERFGATARHNDGERVYTGPFPIFNATVTLTFGGDLAWQERKGTVFAFTPLFSGYHVGWTAQTSMQADADHPSTSDVTTFNGFVPTTSFAFRDQGIDLPTVAAISGAALSPNQGFSSSPALAFLMTLFNVRLGWWIANPRRPRIATSSRRQPSPTFGSRYLLSELFGLANDTTNFVNLCDGGRFDNMGLYELVRRRCSSIVICDGEMDVETTFEGIGLTIAKCRNDFGVEIHLPLEKVLPDKVTGLSAAHAVKGHIRYPAPPGGDSTASCYTGVIIYCKTSLTGDEPADILHYKREHADFPQESTLNQWFTETQFESYRRLGELVGMEAEALL